MAGEERVPADSLASWLPRAHQLPFFALVAFLERATGTRVAESRSAAEERIRFRHDPSMAFSAGDVSRVLRRQVPGEEEIFEVVTTFLGLVGSSTPLPFYFAEEVAQEDPDNPLRREFLDLFHHRLVSLLYRGVTRYTLTGELSGTGADVWSKRVLALAGLDTYEREARGIFLANRLLRLCAAFTVRARTARALEMVLEDALGDALEGGRVSVHQFVGRWVAIEPPDQMRLGKVNSHLGRSTLLGRRAFDRAGSFQIEIGKVPRSVYERFLPDGDLLPVLQEGVRRFNKDPLEYSVVLELLENATPFIQLKALGGSRLGRGSWLGPRRTARTRVEVAVS
jgi:type VI secretion system protein ImpH